MDPNKPTEVTIACGCNRTPSDERVLQEPNYGFFANLTLLFGVTAAPRAIDFRCLACGKHIGSTSDPELLRKNTH
jgi:hypothetical protein